MKHRKDKESIQVMLPSCQHKWKDFPWYVESHWNHNTGLVSSTIYEPYVCVWCKERQNKILDSFDNHASNIDNANHKIDKVLEEYGDKIQPRPIVEDMINDFQLVDREYLEFARTLFPNRGI